MSFRTFRILRMHPLRGSCVSVRSRCVFSHILDLTRAPSAGIVRVGCAFSHILDLTRAPSAGIVRVGALPLCVFAHFGSYACTLLRGSCVSERSRCAFSHILELNRAPSAGIVRVGALPVCVFAYS